MDYLTLQDQFLHSKKIKVGNKIIVTSTARSYDMGWCNSWVPEMDHFVGKKCIFKAKCGSSGIALYSPELQASFSFPFFVIRPVKLKIG